MRKLLFAVSIICSLHAWSWHVSTAQTMKSALIEEYTGIHCPNCPDGHKVGTALRNLHPEDVFLVNIHASAYAVPKPSEPDFRTDLGEFLNNHFEVTFYPGAIVSRVANTADEFVQGRSTWGASARNVTLTPSAVNLWSESSYNPDTRTLTLTVEGYLTDDMADPRINAWLLQNEILGPQSGGQLGVEYPHRHMLRARLNDSDLGDPISEAKKGEYFSRTYTYILPESIKGVPVNADNIELLSFVTDGETNVHKATECRPSGTAANLTFSASSAVAPIPIGKNYAFRYLEVYLNNHGGTPLTDADFEVSINGNKESARWQGEIPPYTNQVIRVPISSEWTASYDNDANKSTLRLVKVNGSEVDMPTMQSSFSSIFTYPADMKIKIKTDLDAADNRYRILDQDGNTVKEFGPYPNLSAAEYEEDIHLTPGEIYCLEISDSWGDGVRHPLGYVKLYDTTGSLVAQIKEINDYGFRTFFRAADPASVASLSSDTLKEYFTISGLRTTPDSPGLYICREGATTTKVIVKP